MELENIEFHRKVRDGYLKLAQMEPDRIKVLNAEEAPDEIYKKIIDIVESKLSC
jgi:dTMP kinase